MATTTTIPAHAIADALRNVTAQLTDARRPHAKITVETLAETLLTIADVIDPPFPPLPPTESIGILCGHCGRETLQPHTDGECGINATDGYMRCPNCGCVYNQDDIDGIHG